MDASTAVHRAYVAFGEQLRVNLSKRTRSLTVLMISAHDMHKRTTVATAFRISMMQDHPAATGRTWQTSGNSALALELVSALRGAGIPTESGEPLLDHGGWVPLSLLFPLGSEDPLCPIALVTLSLAADMDTAAHWRLGEVLAPFRSRDVLIIGSGGATHSQDHFRAGYFGRQPVDEPLPFSSSFNDWLRDAVTEVAPTPVEVSPAGSSRPASRMLRRQRALLRDAPQQPTWPTCHPTLDHWLPLLVAAGAAGESRASVAIAGYQHSLSALSFLFDEPEVSA
jgi:4,5-DOPA dioxygenase extradiol